MSRRHGGGAAGAASTPRAPVSLHCGITVVCGSSVPPCVCTPVPSLPSRAPDLSSLVGTHISRAQGALRCDLGYSCCVLFCLLYSDVKYFKHNRQEKGFAFIFKYCCRASVCSQAPGCKQVVKTTSGAGAGTLIPVLAPDRSFSCASRTTAAAGIPHGCGKALVTRQTVGWNSRDSWSACRLWPGAHHLPTALQ